MNLAPFLSDFFLDRTACRISAARSRFAWYPHLSVACASLASVLTPGSGLRPVLVMSSVLPSATPSVTFLDRFRASPPPRLNCGKTCSMLKGGQAEFEKCCRPVPSPYAANATAAARRCLHPFRGMAKQVLPLASAADIILAI